MKRYDPAPFFSRAEAMGVSISELARRLRCDRVTLQRYREKGIPEDRADAYAFALGVMPHDLWSEWIDDAVESEEARQRAIHAAAKKRWRETRSEEKKRAELDYLAAYREQYREYLNAQRRARYQRNREAEIAANVARKQRKRREQAS